MQNKPKKRMTKDLGTQFYDDNPFDHKQAVQNAISKSKPGEPLLSHTLENGPTISIWDNTPDGHTRTDAHEIGVRFGKPELYEPRVGDRVSVEVTVVELESEIIWLRGHGVLMGVDRSEVSCLTLLSRKTRKFTKAEAEALLTEKLGESVEIE